jgi:hypothetical protein
MFKACQHGTTYEKVCKILKYVFIKLVLVDLQKCIPWPKEIGKERQEWSKAYVEVGMCPRKLNRSMTKKKVCENQPLCIINGYYPKQQQPNKLINMLFEYYFDNEIDITDKSNFLIKNLITYLPHWVSAKNR